MSNGGWIKLYRKFTKWEWYQKSDMVHLFIHLLLLANHEEDSWQGIKVGRGQLITGREKLSVHTGLSQQTIRTCLDRLKSTNEITIKPTNKFSLITIIRYDDYQKLDEELTSTSTNNLTNNQPTTNQQLTTNKNIKNEKNDKEEKNNTVRKFQPPTIQEIGNYLREIQFNIDPKKFFDHYEANGWMAGKVKMKDWKATVRNWKHNQYGQPQHTPSHPNVNPEPPKKTDAERLAEAKEFVEYFDNLEKVQPGTLAALNGSTKTGYDRCKKIVEENNAKS